MPVASLIAAQVDQLIPVKWSLHMVLVAHASLLSTCWDNEDSVQLGTALKKPF